MANSQHAALLGEGARTWNAWRGEHPAVVPDLNDLGLSVGRRQFGPIQGGPIDLSRAQLCRADLEYATLIEASLREAALVQADLSFARLTKADLRGANLTDAHLDHADLKDAQLDDAVLCGARLRHARNLTQAQIDRAHGDETTTLPPRLTMPDAWLTGDDVQPSRLAKQNKPRIDDPSADPYAVLGVTRKASRQQIRAAYLKLVKELHPDGRFSDPIADDRLKAVNKAYHDLKLLEQRAASRRAESGTFGRPGALFFVGFLASSIAMSAVLGGLYYGGFFGSQAHRPVAAKMEHTEPARTARADDVVTGSISKQETATPQADAAEVAAMRRAADDTAWAEAQRDGTSVALHRYLGHYPNGRHAPQAAQALVAVVAAEIAMGKTYDWRDAPAAAEAARLTLRRYLDVYPNGLFVAEARAKLQAIDAGEAALLADNGAWAEAERTATSEAVRRYLAAYPGGNHAARAQQAIAALEAVEAQQRAERTAWTEAEGSGTTQALRRYLDAHPEGHHIAEARQKLALLEAADAERMRDDADWSQAQQRNTKAALAAYLGTYPNGRNANVARASLAERESLATKTETQATIKAAKQGALAPRPGRPDASASQRWQSADEPFVGADGRIRQR